jgi:hypothetical protein
MDVCVGGGCTGGRTSDGGVLDGRGNGWTAQMKQQGSACRSGLGRCEQAHAAQPSLSTADRQHVPLPRQCLT